MGLKAYNIVWAGPETGLKKAVKFKVSYSLDGGRTWKAIGAGYVTGTARHKTWTPPRPTKTRKTWKVMVEGYNAKSVEVGTAESASTLTVQR